MFEIAPTAPTQAPSSYAPVMRTRSPMVSLFMRSSSGRKRNDVARCQGGRLGVPDFFQAARGPDAALGDAVVVLIGQLVERAAGDDALLAGHDDLDLLAVLELLAV